MIRELQNLNGLQLTKVFINLNNYIRRDCDVSKSICKPNAATKSVLQSTNDQSTISTATAEGEIVTLPIFALVRLNCDCDTANITIVIGGQVVTAQNLAVDAFLILALVDKMNIDLVPESNVDETITDIQGLFVSYMRNRTKDNLEILLSTIRKMLSELYMTCNSDEKEIFKKHLETLQNIAQPNII